jgi:heme a synthase
MTTPAQTITSIAATRPEPRQRGHLIASRFAWGVLWYNVAVILWGAVVRATGSGAGCGDHWPLCNGTVFQAHPRIATLIELTHRMTSGITVFAVLALLVWTFRTTSRGHLARLSAVGATVLTFNEALLGALLVLLHLTADNHSPARAVYLSLHLANTLLLLGALALTGHFLARTSAFARGAVYFRNLAPAIIGLAATLVVGVTGSLAALGDTLFPSGSLRAAFAQDFSGRSGWLLRLRFLHPITAIVAGAFIAWLVVRAILRGSADNRVLAACVVALLLLQYGLGVADVALLAPVWMQILHLLGADLLWVALVVLAARVTILPHSASKVGGSLFLTVT